MNTNGNTTIDNAVKARDAADKARAILARRAKEPTVEIIERGVPRGQPTFTTRCSGCDSKLKVSKGDGKLTFDQRDGDYVTVSCPVCQKSMTIDARLFRHD